MSLALVLSVAEAGFNPRAVINGLQGYVAQSSGKKSVRVIGTLVPEADAQNILRPGQTVSPGALVAAPGSSDVIGSPPGARLATGSVYPSRRAEFHAGLRLTAAAAFGAVSSGNLSVPTVMTGIWPLASRLNAFKEPAQIDHRDFVLSSLMWLGIAGPKWATSPEPLAKGGRLGAATTLAWGFNSKMLSIAACRPARSRAPLTLPPLLLAMHVRLGSLGSSPMVTMWTGTPFSRMLVFFAAASARMPGAVSGSFI